ncbi:MAG: radical SAM protein [Firmicutes bacterium]|nr:radical SAM protein [Bacillota bacterium]
MQLTLAGLHKNSVVDGPGLRTVVFTQGCPHACPGCHNLQTHDPKEGTVVEVRDVARQILADTNVKGVTFSGGEPFLQARALTALATSLLVRPLSIVIYSGYTYEYLTKHARTDSAIAALLTTADILIDGPFVEAQRDLALLYRGSRNQRIIDVPTSLQAGEIVLSELHYRGMGQAYA